MKCPHCGDQEKQQRFSTNGDGSAGYRCAVCGRLYVEPPIDLVEMLGRLGEMKGQHEVLGKLIADMEAQLKASSGE